MDIAVAGLLPPSFAGSERALPRQNQSEHQVLSTDRQSAGNGQGVRENTLNLYPNFNRQVNSTRQSLLERDATFSQSDTRRFSLREAISTFEQNEALIADPDRPRQVSGIIDEYV